MLPVKWAVTLHSAMKKKKDLDVKNVMITQDFPPFPRMSQILSSSFAKFERALKRDGKIVTHQTSWLAVEGRPASHCP